jgi:hypothetical protein
MRSIYWSALPSLTVLPAGRSPCASPRLGHPGSVLAASASSSHKPPSSQRGSFARDCGGAARRSQRYRVGRPTRASPTTTSDAAFGLALRKWRSSSQPQVLGVASPVERSRRGGRTTAGRPTNRCYRGSSPSDHVVAASADSCSVMKARPRWRGRQRDSACSSAARTVPSRSCVWSPRHSPPFLSQEGERDRPQNTCLDPPPLCQRARLVPDYQLVFEATRSVREVPEPSR